MSFSRIRDFLISLFYRLKPTRSVILYTRKGCTCCDKAKDQLDRFRVKYRLEITTVDVDMDPQLVQKYGLEVPVVLIDGKVRFRGLVNPTLLERLLKSKSS